MATFASLKTRVAAEVGRGATQDTRIADALKDAGLWLERNWNFQPMHRFVSFSITAGVRSLPVPARIKKFNFVRLLGEDGVGDFTILERIDPKDMSGILTQGPKGYWLDALDYIWLDSIPDEDRLAELDYYQLTDWDNLVDATTPTPWPFTYGPDFCLYQACLAVGTKTRQNESTFTKYKFMRDEALQTLMTLADDWEFGGETRMQMEFRPTNYGTDQYP